MHMDTNVMVNNVKKYFKIFQFLAKFLSRNANAHTDEKNFCCKIFCLLKKLDGANMTYDNVCVQKLIFRSLCFGNDTVLAS